MPYITRYEKIANKEGKKEGKREGKIEGKIEGEIDTVRAFLKIGVDIDTVIKATGLSKEEIEKIAETIH